MTIIYCKVCGYRVSTKSLCVWCHSQGDTLSAFRKGHIVKLNNRYEALPGKTKATYVIAMGLEGLTPLEISVITNQDVGTVETLLQQAQVYRVRA